MRHIGFGLALVLGVCTWISGPLGGQSAAASNPSHLVPATHLRNGVCVVVGGVATGTGGTPVTVPLHPSGVETVWLPGLNDKVCKAVLVKGSAAVASDLARDIDAAPVVANGDEYMCPNDDGAAARLYFTYGGHHPAQRVDAQLSGCRWITAPDNGTRTSTTQFNQDLSTLAPSAWRRYFPTS
jgi:hypothetical protein